MLRFEDEIYGERFYRTAADGIIKCYLHLHENPIKSDKDEEPDFTKMTSAEKKKWKQQARKKEKAKEKAKLDLEEKKKAEAAAKREKDNKDKTEEQVSLWNSEPTKSEAMKMIFGTHGERSDQQ